ncbi:MAG: multicopper oxidase domain-containing protein [Phycisphaerales bacterium]
MSQLLAVIGLALTTPARAAPQSAPAAPPLPAGRQGPAAPAGPAAGEQSAPSGAPVVEVTESTVTVGARSAPVFKATGPAGLPFVRGKRGGRLRFEVHNATSLPITMHPHGVVLPWTQDGVPFVTQVPIPPGGRFLYDFAPRQAGTFFLHSHYGWELQDQLVIPLLLDGDVPAGPTMRDVPVVITDFTFRSPPVIFRTLRERSIPMPAPGAAMPPPDLNDVEYDAIPVNGRPAEAADVIRVGPKERLRLRLINASAATNRRVELGGLSGAAISVDGTDIQPVPGGVWELAVAQRLDVRVEVPASGGPWTLKVLGEGSTLRAGVVLALPGQVPPAVPSRAAAPSAAIGTGYEQERRFRAATPLAPRPAARTLQVPLTGEMRG